jgi:dihydrofolate reductase
MTRTQHNVASSIDGYIADPTGSLDWLTPFEEVPGITAHYEGFLAGVRAIAMGASTDEFLLGQGLDEWPCPDQGTWAFTHRDLPRFAGADLELTADDPRAIHARMVRAAAGKNIWLVGG